MCQINNFLIQLSSLGQSVGTCKFKVTFCAKKLFGGLIHLMKLENPHEVINLSDSRPRLSMSDRLCESMGRNLNAQREPVLSRSLEYGTLIPPGP
jgi:hypothetical protein